MVGLDESPQVASLVPEVALDGRVVYFPVRHNSPACAYHVGTLIRDLKPDAVLIEGPRDASDLIPMLVHEGTRLPVAIFTTYVKRRQGELPARYAAYYPLCDYSPELAAIRAAMEVGARASFIDLTFPENVEACAEPSDEKVQSLLEEKYLEHSVFLHAACQRAGLRDPDDLWDHLYEDNYEDLDTREFVRNVLAYCFLGRQDYTNGMLEAEGSIARESGMAAIIAEEKGRVVVVTGGFHTAALPTAKPKMPPKVKVSDDDAQVALVRYSFEQLDRLNGYASGMPSPEFYQRIWEGKDNAELIVEIGREIRKNGGDISADDEIAALTQTARLAQLRGHRRPSREDVLDGVRSAFIKGSVDVEGVVILAHARKFLAGDRVGDVPAEAGLPPIVIDFRETANRLRLNLQVGDRREAALDLYRKAPHREISRFLHRLRFLEVPFAEWVQGPDFVKGTDLDRIQEIWHYRWWPGTESALVERSLYGPTVEEAAAAVLLERFDQAEKEGQGRRADVAAALLLEACRMGLHRHTQDLLERTGRLVAEDASFLSLVRAISDILVLHVSREPLEAHHLEGLAEMAEAGFFRACYLLPGLAVTPEEEEYPTLDALNIFFQVPDHMGAPPEHRELLLEQLEQLSNAVSANEAIAGGVCGLLFGTGRLTAHDLVRHLEGHIVSAGDGVGFLRGLMRTSRSALWQAPEILSSITQLLTDWDEERFIGQLPNLRLAFVDLTPRECDRVARAVADELGVRTLEGPLQSDYSTADMLLGTEVNRRVTEMLERDGLGELVNERD